MSWTTAMRQTGFKQPLLSEKASGDARFVQSKRAFVRNIALINKMLCFMYDHIFWLLFRTVTPQDKSFALGIQFMLFRVLGKRKKLLMQKDMFLLLLKKHINVPNPVMGTLCSLRNTIKVTLQNNSCMSEAAQLWLCFLDVFNLFSGWFEFECVSLLFPFTLPCSVLSLLFV